MFKKHAHVQGDGTANNGPLEPFFAFRWGRNMSWFSAMRSAGRVTVWTRWFAFSFGDRWPVDDGTSSGRAARAHRTTSTTRRRVLCATRSTTSSRIPTGPLRGRPGDPAEGEAHASQ